MPKNGLLFQIPNKKSPNKKGSKNFLSWGIFLVTFLKKIAYLGIVNLIRLKNSKKVVF